MRSLGDGGTSGCHRFDISVTSVMVKLSFLIKKPSIPNVFVNYVGLAD